MTDAFLPVVAPASVYWLGNEYYASDEEFVFALADALHEEYKAIVEAGFLLQVDDAVLLHEYDSIISLGGSLEDYRSWAELRVEALNHALRGIPGGARPLSRLLGQLARPARLRPPARGHRRPRAQGATPALLDRAGQPASRARVAGLGGRRSCRRARCSSPASSRHHTNVVEHPELVADRLVRLAKLVGRENVIGGTDCGFAQGAFVRRVHPSIQWAKLEALAEGARLASARAVGIEGCRLSPSRSRTLGRPHGGVSVPGMKAAPSASAADRVNNVDAVSEALGARIRRERSAAGLTVRGLAARTGVSPSLISQIERGLARPSVATLFSIANELGLSIADLFSGSRENGGEGSSPSSQPVQRHETRKTMTLAQGVRWERLTFAPDDEVDFVYLDYEPGASSVPGDELRSHGGREFGYVLSGTLTIRIGSEEYVLRPDDSISFDSTTPHQLVASADAPMRAIWLVVNRRDDPRLEPLR